jgi:hypothetical protein
VGVRLLGLFLLFVCLHFGIIFDGCFDRLLYTVSSVHEALSNSVIYIDLDLASMLGLLLVDLTVILTRHVHGMYRCEPGGLSVFNRELPRVYSSV